MPRILIDGSSTAYGLWGGSEGGWADRIKFAHMPDRPNHDGKRPLWKVYNLAAPHRTIDDIIAQLPGFIDNYRGEDTALVAVVMAGQVESRYSSASPEPDIPLNYFVNRLYDLATLMIEKSCGLIFAGATPVIEDRVQAVGRRACRYDLRKRIEYDQATCDVASEADIPYVHVMEPLLHAQKAGVTITDDDGLHPNALGHKIIYSLVHDAVKCEVARLQSAKK